MEATKTTKTKVKAKSKAKKLVKAKAEARRGLVVVAAPGVPAEACEENLGLANVQALVDGYVEAVVVGPGLLALCDEEGLLKGKAQTRPGLAFAGTIVVLGTNGANWTGLSKRDAARIVALLNAGQVPPGT